MRGARTHNLKNLSVDVPKDGIVVFTGPSGAGNAVLVVEHDPALIEGADWAIEIGPAAGRKGGELLYSGPAGGLAETEGPAGRVLRGRAARRAFRAAAASGEAGTVGAGASPAVPPHRPWTRSFPVRDARANNLKGVDVDIPLGILVGICGPAGSGKSTLIHEVFAPAHPEAVVVGQGSIGRTSRGTVASYVGAFDLMRKEFAKATGADPGLFSFNSKGACPKCGGAGFLSVEMNFLDDMRMTCDECGGARYKAEVLELKYGGRSVADALAACSRLIELGPAGGAAGGRLLAQGTPEDLAGNPDSVTGPYLREVLG